MLVFLLCTLCRPPTQVPQGTLGIILSATPTSQTIRDCLPCVPLWAHSHYPVNFSSLLVYLPLVWAPLNCLPDIFVRTDLSSVLLNSIIAAHRFQGQAQTPLLTLRQKRIWHMGRKVGPPALKGLWGGRAWRLAEDTPGSLAHEEVWRGSHCSFKQAAMEFMSSGDQGCCMNSGT